jgi:hypothetical protein
LEDLWPNHVKGRASKERFVEELAHLTTGAENVFPRTARMPTLSKANLLFGDRKH